MFQLFARFFSFSVAPRDFTDFCSFVDWCALYKFCCCCLSLAKRDELHLCRLTLPLCLKSTDIYMKLHKMGDVFKSTIDAKQKMPSYGSLNSASGHKMPGSSNSSFDHSKYRV